ncbi:MAG: hypothetical protein AAFO03_05890 [Bacteroidota bacterium]
MVYYEFSNHPFSTSPRTGVTANIVLGSPKKNCEGVGICRIERARDHQKKSAHRACLCTAKALLSAKDDQHLLIFLVKHSLAACAVKKHFQGEFFQMEEPVMLPEAIRQELALPTPFWLSAGHYEITDIGHHLALKVALSPALTPSEHLLN